MWSTGVLPVRVVLSYCPTGVPKLGSFKATLFGQVAPSLPGFASSGSVVLKQFYKKPKNPERKNPAGSQEPIEILPSGQQIIDLSREILCTQWASALMDIVYEFITNSSQGSPPFPIPQMRFVHVALALEYRDDADTDRKVFMLEERISPHEHGGWRKYINNDSPAPIRSSISTTDLQHVADFLVFCQHVQFLQTLGRAFVSDFQGGLTLLSDPQIVTAPYLKGVFAGGNIGSAYVNFVDKHQCSKFCKFYCLEAVASVSQVERSVQSGPGSSGEVRIDFKAVSIIVR
ncbi:hypothetical protein PYCCODRAFT_1376221 [Trametes coccinea BRFM310]|uniref:Alpha-type protein kinase domain-containing protein n=1 Tax=Trametes coccinea (strain BRFM310) TaxID=1353009 RepID=A0A1Y2IA33_TRAC3|nr:hypothetical protein PYCCODRAFT_1376221 [Trametes coccinea BRFM310]